MNRFLTVLVASVFSPVLVSSTQAAIIPLTAANLGTSNVYSYALPANGPADPNATLLGILFSATGAYTGSNFQTPGTRFRVQYTFDLAPQANNLNLTGANHVTSGGALYRVTDGVELNYTLSGGSTIPTSGQLGNWLTILDPDGNGTVVPFDVNIPLTPSASTTTVTITFTQNHLADWSEGFGEGWRQQILRNSQPFVATAAFIPEPTSLGLLAASALFALRRRRH